MTLDGKKLRALAFGAFMGGAALAVPGEARAAPVSPDGKGIVGGALLGGEVISFGEAIFGVESPVAYAVGGGIGLVGGAFAGYGVEKAVSDGRIPAYMLAGGVAALIPAVVVILDATRYKPTEGAREDKPTAAPPPDPGQPGGSSVIGAPAAPATPVPPQAPPGASTPAAAPGTNPVTPASGTTTGGTQKEASRSAPAPSLVGVREGQLALGVPVPEVSPILAGSSERARLGIDNRGSELRFPVLHVTF